MKKWFLALLIFIPVFSLLFSSSAFAGNYRVNSLSFSSPVKPDISEFSQGYSYFLFNPRTLGNFRISSPVFTINEKILVPLRVGESIHLAYVFSTGNASNVPVCPAPLANTFYELRSCTITAMDASVSSIKNVSIDTVTYPSNLFSYRIELDFTIVQDMDTLTLPMGGDFAHLYLSSSAASSFELFFDTVVINNRPLSDDAQAQIDFQKQQAEKEEKQRQEDEKKAQDAGDKSQADSDKSQSDVNDSSGNLFTVINGVKDVILQGSNTGNCSISGDFGFFNVGSINLCSGSSYILPITNVVGTVMVVFFMFMAALTLLQRFKDLYFKYIGGD